MSTPEFRGVETLGAGRIQMSAEDPAAVISSIWRWVAACVCKDYLPHVRSWHENPLCASLSSILSL